MNRWMVVWFGAGVLFTSLVSCASSGEPRREAKARSPEVVKEPVLVEVQAARVPVEAFPYMQEDEGFRAVVESKAGALMACHQRASISIDGLVLEPLLLMDGSVALSHIHYKDAEPLWLMAHSEFLTCVHEVLAGLELPANYPMSTLSLRLVFSPPGCGLRESRQGRRGCVARRHTRVRGTHSSEQRL